MKPIKTFRTGEKQWRLDVQVPADPATYTKCRVLALRFNDEVHTVEKAVLKIKASKP